MFKIAGLIVGVILFCAGLVMLAVQLRTDFAWEPATAQVEGVGVVCELKWVEVRLSRNPYRPHYRTLPCDQVAEFQARHSELGARVREVTVVDVRFRTTQGSEFRATGRHTPEAWRAPALGATVPITYDPANPTEISWQGGALRMYVAGAIIACFGAVLIWFGWPWSGAAEITPPIPPTRNVGIPGPRSAHRSGFGRRVI
jgi:hypothetical protein